jgi:transposase
VTSVLGSLTVGGIESAMTIIGGTSGPVFSTFVEHFLLPKLHPGHVVVLDNVGAHKTKNVKDLIESKGASLEPTRLSKRD